MTKRNSKPYPKTANAFPEPVEEYLSEIARQAAGKRLSKSLPGGWPLNQLIGVVELPICGRLAKH